MNKPIFEITQIKDPYFNKKLLSIKKDLEAFFEIPIELPLILLTRQSDLATIRQKKTDKHILGYCRFNTIFITKNVRKTHPKTFWKILTHEYVHLAMKNFCKTGPIYPQWLKEGLPCYIAKQNKPFDMTDKEKLLSHYYKNYDFGIYAFGYNIVKDIIEKYGKKKILEMLSKTTKLNTYNKFKKYYKNI